MPKDKKGFALLIAGKPAKEAPDEEYEGEDVSVDEEEVEEPAAEAEAEYPEFDIPAELDLSDMEDGDEKEVVAVVRKKGEGTACIVSVDGVQLGEGGEVPVEEELPAEAPPPGPPLPAGLPGAGIAQRALGAGLM